MNEEMILTADLVTELIDNRHLSQLRSLTEEMQAEDIAELFLELPDGYLSRFFRILHKDIAADVFASMDPEQQEVLILAFSDAELRNLLDEMFYDDTVDLIEEMPASVVQRIIANSTPEDRRVINELLRYPADSAGGNMTTEFVRLKPDYTVSQALSEIRRVGVNKETIYTCYVTDNNRHLLGVVAAKDLLLSQGDVLIKDIMEENVISCGTHDDQEQVAQLFSKYGFIALPVVDTENRLVGIVTIDDAVEIMQEEAQEDLSILSAVTPDETPYLRTTPWEIWKNRFPWLALLMLSATFTGIIISAFEDALSRVVVLTAFIPMLMGTGGNSGSQAAVTIISALSRGELELRDWLKVVWKEVRVSVMCGITLAVLALGKVMLVDNLIMGNPDVSFDVALVVSLTLCVTVICAKLIGCSLPILAKKIKLDPAVVASPFITTIVDALSLLVYFWIACSFIPGLN